MLELHPPDQGAMASSNLVREAAVYRTLLNINKLTIEDRNRRIAELERQLAATRRSLDPVLAELQVRPAASNRELARCLGWKEPRTSRRVTQLIAAGQVTRTQDGRRKRIALAVQQEDSAAACLDVSVPANI